MILKALSEQRVAYHRRALKRPGEALSANDNIEVFIEMPNVRTQARRATASSEGTPACEANAGAAPGVLC